MLPTLEPLPGKALTRRASQNRTQAPRHRPSLNRIRTLLPSRGLTQRHRLSPNRFRGQLQTQCLRPSLYQVPILNPVRHRTRSLRRNLNQIRNRNRIRNQNPGLNQIQNRNRWTTMSSLIQ